MSEPDSGLLIPFQIEAGAVRGRLVRLDSALDEIVGSHHLPMAVGERVAETVLLAAALAGGLKFDGIFTLQVQSDGPISLIVADAASNGDLRAYARFDEERLAAAEASSVADPVQKYFGKGYLAFTVDQGPDTDRYQGIVELDGATLAECTENYLEKSEQLGSAVVTAVAPPEGERGWRGSALIVQRMPPSSNGPILTAERADEDWRRAAILMRSVSRNELLDVAPALVLHRLFHADGLIPHDPRALRAQCRCSLGRVQGALATFTDDDIAAMADEMGEIVVTCEFCKSRYAFTGDDIRALRKR